MLRNEIEYYIWKTILFRKHEMEIILCCKLSSYLDVTTVKVLDIYTVYTPHVSSVTSLYYHSMFRPSWAIIR
jgi:hypothetical protein